MLHKEIMRTYRRENRVRQLELILTIVTTLAVVFLSFALIILGIIKIQENHYNTNPAPIIAPIEPNPIPIPEILPNDPLKAI